jgi:Mrp family chromosome partitioning ATPase
MSKNFELLREAGWRQEIFEGLPCPAAEDPEPTPPPKASRPATTASRQTAAGQPTPPQLPGDQVSQLVRKVFIESPNRSVMFLGTERGAVCTWACAQAARTLSRAVNGKVCVVDANFGSPALHEHFGKVAPSGLADAVFASKPAKEFAERLNGKNLWLLTAGSEEKRTMVLQNKSFLQSHLRELRDDFDYILVDGPTLSSDPTLASVGRSVDGGVLVLESAGVAPNLLLKAKKQLNAAKLPLLGAVLMQSKSDLPPILDRLMK